MLIDGEMKITAITTIMTLIASPAWAAPFMDITPAVRVIQIGTIVLIGITIFGALLKSKSFKG